MYLMNYNFLSDKNIIDPSPTKIEVISGAQLSNAIFDHFNVLNSSTAIYDEDIPTEWTNDTIIDADFAGNINGGNLTYSTKDLAGIKIKRRIKGEFEWLTLYNIETNNVEDLNFTRYDILNQNGVIYEYALVPYLIGGMECAYITKEIGSLFDGVFLCSPNVMVKCFAGTSYGSSSLVNQVGVFEPIGSKYPIVVCNADTNYYSGSLNATAMTYSQLNEDVFIREDTTNYLKSLTQFVTNKEVKLLKDWNGNIWLIAITSGADISYNNMVGMGLADVSFSFVEIGAANDQYALEEYGFINNKFIPSLSSRLEPTHSDSIEGAPHHHGSDYQYHGYHGWDSMSNQQFDSYQGWGGHHGGV